jgi:hypothetical protein
MQARAASMRYWKAQLSDRVPVSLKKEYLLFIIERDKRCLVSIFIEQQKETSGVGTFIVPTHYPCFLLCFVIPMHGGCFTGLLKDFQKVPSEMVVI